MKLLTPRPRARRVEPPHGFCRSIFSTRSSRGLAARGWIRTLLKRCALSSRGGFFGKAIAYDNRQTEIPAAQIESLRWHPVRLLSFLDSPYYYGAKKKYLDWIAARQLASGRYDLFHSWSGDCLLSLRMAHKKGIPSVLEIPTWHRDRGKIKRNQPALRLPSRSFPGGNAGRKICSCSASASSRNTISRR